MNRRNAARLLQWFSRELLPWQHIPDILWSKGSATFCDCSGPRWYPLSHTETAQTERFFLKHYKDAKGVVWLRLATGAREGSITDLDRFARAVLHRLQHPIVIVTTDGDSSVPADISPRTVSAILDCPKVIAWYTQNHDGSNHPKIRPFPIGLDLHSWNGTYSPSARLAQLHALSKGRAPIETLPATIFCDAHLALSSGERFAIVPSLQGVSHVTFLPSRVPRLILWQHYARHPFVISPRGNGFDCHRSWEILLAGSIVITRPQPIAPLFEGLAVWTVKDWDELRDLSLVEHQLKILAPITAHDYVWNRLKASTWIEKIRSETGLSRNAPSS